MPLRLALAAAVLLIAATAASDATAAGDTIRAQGSASGFGRVLAIGAFKPERDPTLAAAISAFGDPSSRRRSGDTACRVSWSGVGLAILFANFGGGGACDPRYGRAQRGRANGSRWRTGKGLRVGDRVRRLIRLHPRASRHGRVWWLVSGVSLYGSPSRRYPVLAAAVSRGRVASLKLEIGAAGD